MTTDDTMHPGNYILTLAPLLGALLLSTGSGEVWAQDRASDREVGYHYVQNFGSDVYRAATQNWAIVQDPRGIIYVGNGKGVLEYDGIAWRLIPLPGHSSGISLAVDRQGRVFVGGEGLFGYLAPGPSGVLHFQSLVDQIPPPNRQFAEVWETVAAHDGVYFNATTFLFRWQADEPLQVWTPDVPIARAFSIRDTLYVQQVDVGLSRVENDTFSLVSGEDLFKDAGLHVVQAHGDQWLCWARDGLFLYDGEAMIPFPVEDPEAWQNDEFGTGASLASGLIALARARTGLALLKPSGELIQVLDKRHGLRDQIIYAMLEDQAGALWLAMDDGLARVDVSTALTFHDERVGLEGKVMDVTRYEGRLYAADKMGAYAYDAAGLRFNRIEALTGESRALIPTPFGLVIGGEHGVSVLKNGQVEHVMDGIVLALWRSRRDTTWMYAGGSDGVQRLRLENGAWTYDQRVEGVASIIFSLVEDEDGMLWAATFSEGVYRIVFHEDQEAPPAVHRFDTRHGLARGLVWLTLVDGTAVFQTTEGLFQYDAGGFTPYLALGTDLQRRVTGSQVMHQDAQGDLWLNTFDHTFGVARRQPGGSYRWDATVLQRMPPGELFSIYPEPGGVIWLGGVHGLIRYDTSQRQSTGDVPPTLIRRITATRIDSVVFGGAGGTEGTEHVLLPDSRSLRFDFALPVFDVVASNAYRYRLEGLEPDWSDWGAGTIKEYTQLPYGSYVFHVQGRDVYRREGPEARFAFYLKPTWYQTPWATGVFGLLLLAMIIGLGHIYSRHRTFRVKTRNLSLAEEVRRRTQELLRQKQMLEEANRQLEHSNRSLTRANQALERTNVSLKQLNEQHSEFLGIAAHDLKSPLANILGFSEALIDESQAGSSHHFRLQSVKFLPIVHNEARRMLTILQELLHAQTLESGSVQLQQEEVGLVSLVQTVLRWNEVRATEKDISLHVESRGEVWAWVDEAMMQRVLDNLVSNAVKFSPRNQNVFVKVQRRGGQALISVHDQGPGLTEVDKEKVFCKLQRLSARPTGGEASTGLGLFIVKTLVELHGGQVWVDSEYGYGATFTVSLPATRPAQETGSQEMPQHGEDALAVSDGAELRYGR